MFRWPASKTFGSFAILVCLASLLFSYPAVAQSRPYGGEYYNSPMYAMAPYDGYVRDYPAGELRAVPAAVAVAASARAQHRIARSELHGGVAVATDRFRRSSELRQAVQAERKAHLDLDAARERALQPLAEDENYQAHTQIQQRLGEYIREQHQDPEAPQELIRAAAGMKLEQAIKARARETELLSDAGEVANARRRLHDAHRQVDELHEGFVEQVRSDPELTAARKNLREARAAHIVADAYLNAVLDVGYLALDYAYWLHEDEHGRSRLDRYQYGYSSYGDGSYYSSGYYGHGGGSKPY
jgi:hypothetical protein